MSTLSSPAVDLIQVQFFHLLKCGSLQSEANAAIYRNNPKLCSKVGNGAQIRGWKSTVEGGSWRRFRHGKDRRNSTIICNTQSKRFFLQEYSSFLAS